MTTKPLVAYVSLFSRKSLSIDELKASPELKEQLYLVRKFAKTTGRKLLTTFTRQSTYRRKTFFHEEQFQLAIRECDKREADLVVADLFGLMSNLNVEETKSAITRLSGLTFLVFSAADGGVADPAVLLVKAKAENLERKRRRFRTQIGAEARGAKADRAERSGTGLRGAKIVAKKSDDRARTLAPLLASMIGSGQSPSLGEMAQALNGKGIPTPRGGVWHHGSVRRVIERCRKLKLLD